MPYLREPEVSEQKRAIFLFFPSFEDKQAENPFLAKQPSKKKIDGCIGGTKAEK